MGQAHQERAGNSVARKPPMEIFGVRFLRTDKLLGLPGVPHIKPLGSLQILGVRVVGLWLKKP